MFPHTHLRTGPDCLLDKLVCRGPLKPQHYLSITNRCFLDFVDKLAIAISLKRRDTSCLANASPHKPTSIPLQRPLLLLLGPTSSQPHTVLRDALRKSEIVILLVHDRLYPFLTVVKRWSSQRRRADGMESGLSEISCNRRRAAEEDIPESICLARENLYAAVERPMETARDLTAARRLRLLESPHSVSTNLIRSLPRASHPIVSLSITSREPLLIAFTHAVRLCRCCFNAFRTILTYVL